MGTVHQRALFFYHPVIKEKLSRKRKNRDGFGQTNPFFPQSVQNSIQIRFIFREKSSLLSIWGQFWFFKKADSYLFYTPETFSSLLRQGSREKRLVLPAPAFF
jgi:hypothetical protein